MERGRPSRWFVVVCAVGALVRVGYVLVFRSDTKLGYGDAYSYSAGADLLVGGHGFVEPMAVLGGLPADSANHPPLYTIWLAMASFVDPGHTTSPIVHMLWSSVLGIGTVVLCGLVGRRLAGERAGIVAAGVAAVYPNLWVHDGMLLSETLGAFTIALTLWTAYRFWDRPTVARVAWLGACCGLAALSRSELVLTVPFVLVPLALMVRGPALPQRAKLVGLGAVVAAAVISPWMIYNASRFDATVLMSTNAGGASAAANCDSTYYGDLIGYKDYVCADDTYNRVAARTPDWAELDVAQQDQLVREEVSHYIRDHAGRLPVVAAVRVGRLLKVFGVGQEYTYDTKLHGQEPGVVVGGLVAWYVLAPLAVAGAVILRRRGVLVYPLVAVVALVFAAVAVTFAQTRYRAPAEPAVVLLAAVAIEAAWARRRAEPPTGEATAEPGDPGDPDDHATPPTELPLGV
jgi:4-amino-4-deoxy-L-arabinose transferase-like glycosyltransferase